MLDPLQLGPSLVVVLGVSDYLFKEVAQVEGSGVARGQERLKRLLAINPGSPEE